ncbi:MAG: DUF6152 family protein [Pseudomonadota bacterium]|nr:DUF6152 family protein [Pseudomonadota bacterium]
MRISQPAAVFAAAMLSSVASSARAHHSLAMFDMDKSAAVDGTLKSVQWTNPHSWFVLTAAGPEGAAKDWQIEGPSPNGLTRQGWKHNDINAGDRVTLTFHPRKDGTAGGMLIAVRLPTGKELRLIGGPPPAATGGAAGSEAATTGAGK